MLLAQRFGTTSWHKADLCRLAVNARNHSALIPAARITLPHFSVSSAISLPYSAGEPDSGVPPMSRSRDLIVGSARPAFIFLLSRSMIAAAVPFDAATPNHEPAAEPITNSPQEG